MVRSIVVVKLSLIAALACVFACSTKPDNSAFMTPDGSASGSADATMPEYDGPSLGMQTDAPLPTGCVSRQCVAAFDNCAGKNMPLTAITGRVYDPAGQLPLYNVYVYIPNETPAPIEPGNPTCTQCEAPASGSPVIGTLTNAQGEFTLQQGAGDMWGVPSGTNIPLVIQVGKWRKQITVASVPACQSTAIPNPSTPSERLRLPAKSSEGDMPMMAFTSGCDPAECFLRHIGIDDSEFVPPDSTTGHVHFYTGCGSQRDGSLIAGTESSA